MKQRRWYALFSVSCVIILTAVILGGCSAASSETAAASNGTPPVMASGSNAAMPAIDENATYVQVQSVDDDTITALVGTMTQPTGQPGGNGQINSDGQAQAAPQGTPGQPTGSAGDQQAAPSDGNGGPGKQGQGGVIGFTVGTETITFAVSDSTTITKMSGPESTDAALSDIVVGDILAVTLSSDNTAETIAIQQTIGAPEATAQTN